MAKKKPQKQKVNQATNNNDFSEKTKPNTILCEAQVVEVLPNTNFKVKLKDFGTVIDAKPSGKVRMNHIRILKGDLVIVELSTYELTKGRITYRIKVDKTKKA